MQIYFALNAELEVVDEDSTDEEIREAFVARFVEPLGKLGVTLNRLEVGDHDFDPINVRGILGCDWDN